MLTEDFVDDLVASFGGCLLMYQTLLKQTNVAAALKELKLDHIQYLLYVLDMQKGQSFSKASLERYDLLQAVARGEKIISKGSPAAKYLLAKHGEIPAFLGVHPDGHLVFAIPMTKQALLQIEERRSLPVYLCLMRYIGWLCLK